MYLSKVQIQIPAESLPIPTPQVSRKPAVGEGDVVSCAVFYSFFPFFSLFKLLGLFLNGYYTDRK